MVQSYANRSPARNSLIYGKIEGNLRFSRQSSALSPAKSACHRTLFGNPLRIRTGNFRTRSGNRNSLLGWQTGNVSKSLSQDSRNLAARYACISAPAYASANVAAGRHAVRL